jgi:hypothetical protein
LGLGGQDDRRRVLEVLRADRRLQHADLRVDEVQRATQKRAGCDAIGLIAAAKAAGRRELLGGGHRRESMPKIAGVPTCTVPLRSNA